jgi:signal peptidase II
MPSLPRSRLIAFVLIAVLGCALDLWTKSWIFGKLGMPGQAEPIVLWPRVFSLTTSLNEGALFGLGQGMTFLFAGLSIVAAAGIFYWLFRLGAARDWVLTISLGAIMGGIFGNLYDRVGLPGLQWNFPADRVGEPVYAVRDWLHFRIEDAQGGEIFDWPVFNIADCLLVTGSILLVLYGLRQPAPAAEKRVATNGGSEPSPRAAQF